MRHRLAIALAGAGMLVALAVPAAGQGPMLAMLDKLEPGGWEMRFRGENGGSKRLCLDDARKLIQLRHPGIKCDRVVVEDSSSEVTVHYTCPGRGYGRTQIRRETNSLVQIDSQGIANGQPFAFAAEARRVGDCTN